MKLYYVTSDVDEDDNDPWEAFVVAFSPQQAIDLYYEYLTDECGIEPIRINHMTAFVVPAIPQGEKTPRVLKWGSEDVVIGFQKSF